MARSLFLYGEDASGLRYAVCNACLLAYGSAPGISPILTLKDYAIGFTFGVTFPSYGSFPTVTKKMDDVPSHSLTETQYVP